MDKYSSIKEEVLQKLTSNMEEIQERFGIETLGIFGSVSRGEDTLESDIDIFYEFAPDKIDYSTFLDLCDYLENLLGRSIEMVSVDSMPQRFRKNIEPDMYLLTGTVPA